MIKAELPSCRNNAHSSFAHAMKTNRLPSIYCMFTIEKKTNIHPRIHSTIVTLKKIHSYRNMPWQHGFPCSVSVWKWASMHYWYLKSHFFYLLFIGTLLIQSIITSKLVFTLYQHHLVKSRK